jgi:hypothetical protein
VPLPVDVIGTLTVTSESGEQFHVEGGGCEIAINLPNLWIGQSLLKQTSGRKKRQTMIRKAHAMLRRADLRLRVRIAGQSVAYLSPDSQESLISKLFGLGAVELKPLALLLAVIRSI